ncbi:tRNA pseudouridine(13) synthase TruD [Candidatus Woesearchaeota archaeon]|nr:tRNA pseudouridine(13) synthase TruD [Candidatus Woesearchaeota archaeon]
MYKIKQKPEDFIVKEIPWHELDENGEYSYFWLTKINYNTIDAIKRIALRLNIPLKKVGFAGTKDKNAITKQTISIKSVEKEKVESIKLKDIKLEYIGKGKDPISLGDLKGNEFVIVVRNLKTKLSNESEKGLEVPRELRRRIKKRDLIPNLFGPQRFSKNNAEVGKFLVKRNFQKAIDLINQEEVKESLEKNPLDLIGALRQLPLKTRKIYIHAYQSLLWNKTVEAYLETGSYKNIKIPIIGFGTEIENIQDSDLKKIIIDILDKEEISIRDFILPQVKELSSEGTERDLFVKPENLEISISEDKLNKNRFKAIISFSLKKGSYATTIIDYLFKSP